VVAAAAVLVFAPTVGFELTNWDDPVYLTESRLVRDLSPSGLARIFDPRSHVVYDWTPIVTLTHALEVRVGGGVRPALHHATNVGLHALAAGLVVGLLRRMGFSLGVAVVGALLFALHPLQVESVAWVSGRKTILATLFGVLCARAYWDARSRRGRAGAAAWFAAALLSKATLVALPLWLAAADRARGRLRTGLPWVLGLAALALGRASISVWAQQSVIEEASGRGLFGRLAVMGPVLARYVRQTLFPTGLAAHYTWPTLGWGDPHVIASWSVVIAVVALLAWAARRDPAVGLAGLWVGMALLPVLNLLPAPHLQADRYLYTALVGGGALLAAPFLRLAGHARLRPAVAVAGVGALVLLGAASIQRSNVWRASVPLWEDTLRKDPDFAVALGNLGAALLAEDRLEEADTSLRRAIELEPRLTEARLALSVALRRRGALDEAQREVEAALEVDPRNFGALVTAGELAELRGDSVRARSLYEEALRNRPHAVRALERLALLEANAGELDRALAHVEQARRLRPDRRGIAISEAWVLARAERGDESRLRLKQLAEDDPEWAEPLYTLALLELDRGEPEAARGALDGALEREPRHARARTHRARLRSASGDRAGAEADLRVAAEVVPFRLSVVLPLADLLTEEGKSEEALSFLERTASVRESPEVLRRIAQLSVNVDPAGARRAARRALALLDENERPPWRAHLERIAQ
jgi:tetratricopeptide (TPR) repeat protein